MDRKLNEFLALTQGNRTVLQYAQAFNDLCQYAGYHVDTDEKERDRFRRGLSTKLRDRLNTVRANSYNELVNMAISQEDCITARQAEKKRKTPVAGPSAQPQCFRIVSDTAAAADCSFELETGCGWVPAAAAVVGSPNVLAAAEVLGSECQTRS